MAPESTRSRSSESLTIRVPVDYSTIGVTDVFPVNLSVDEARAVCGGAGLILVGDGVPDFRAEIVDELEDSWFLVRLLD
jgi:hypothetical protein